MQDNQTSTPKTEEVVYYYIQGNSNKVKDEKEALEEFNYFDFNMNKPKIPDSISLNVLVKEMILRERIKSCLVYRPEPEGW